MKNTSKKKKNTETVDRDTSLQKFNERVLLQAADTEIPLLERLNFSAIFTNNSDEFFKVRAGEALNRAILCQSKPKIKKYYLNYRAQLETQNKIDEELISSLKNENIWVCDWRDLDNKEKKCAKDFFRREIIPHIFIHLLHDEQPMPFIEDKGYAAIVTSDGDSNERKKYVIIISKQVPKILKISSNGITKILLLERVLSRFLPMTVNAGRPCSVVLFRVIRNSDIEYVPKNMSKKLKYRDEIHQMMCMRDKLSAVCLDAIWHKNIPDDEIQTLFKRKFGLKKYQIIAKKVSFSAGWKSELISDLGKSYVKLLYPKISKCTFETDNILKKIDNNDILISYPYHSTDIYLSFLRQAISSDLTKSIKITLYRLGSKSEIVALLCAAAVKGIEVTAVIELRARFDEESNIRWSDVLENAGCKVIYGFPPYKVHAKLTLIEQYSASQYAHIATGNYNETTSNLYTDLGILTADPRICADVRAIFDNIESDVISSDYKSLLVAPSCLKNKIIEEVKMQQTLGKNGYIFMKMNSLTDPEIIDSLVEASQSGAKIDLVVRGICCLLPQVQGKTENIRVISLVGRYLEHSRIYIFGQNEHIRRTYIGSADMMTRNTEKRIEVLTPIFDDHVAKAIYKMTRIMLSDNKNAFIMQNDGNYCRSKPNKCEETINS